MAAGLQVWDGGGGLIFDTNDRVGRVIGSVYTGGANGSIVHGELGAGQGFAIPLGVGFDGAGALPTVRVDGSTLSWNYYTAPGFSNLNCLIIYGVY